MDNKPESINAPAAFSRSGHVLRNWPISVIFMALGLILFVTYDRAANPGWKLFFLSAGMFLLGAAILAVGLHRRNNPGLPDVELSANGILYRSNLATPVLIPWHEVRDVRRVAFTPKTVTNLGSNNRAVETIRDMTVALVSEAYFSAVIDPGFAKRSVFWGESFERDGDEVMVAFNHRDYGVESAVVFDAVKSRWLSHRDQGSRSG